MTMRVLVIPDKFKGTLTSQQAGAAIAAGWRKFRPADMVETIPMSDGGDGFGQVLSELRGAVAMPVATVDAAHRPRQAVWWHDREGGTAIIESALVVGLALLPPGEFHPFALDTRGLAEVFHAAQRAGARRCVVGVGGSATNDGGMGLARGMGWRFARADGSEITAAGQLEGLAEILPPPAGDNFDELLVAVDVKNPLLGPNGCSRIFGPQKGLRLDDMERAEAGLRRLADELVRVTGRDCRDAMGAGAAGGLGFGLQAFFGAKPVDGFQLISEATRLTERLARADLVITGEGALDASSVMGKATGSVAEMCRQRGMPCLAFAGVVLNRDKLSGLFREARALVEIAPEIEAKREAGRWLEKLAGVSAREWSGG
jgi:glycerate kinase